MYVWNMKESYNHIYNPKIIWNKSNLPKNYRFKDEEYTYRLSNNYLFPRFVCVHYAFGSQRRKGLSEDLLEIYKSISKEYVLNI